MAGYDAVFDNLGLRAWCDQGTKDSLMSMSQLLASVDADKANGGTKLAFPSLDALHQACAAIPRTRDMTKGVENTFLAMKDGLKFVLDPLTQPLSWMLEATLYVFATIPWWVMIPLLIAAAWFSTKRRGVTILVAVVFVFFGLIDHLDVAMQTLAIIFVCTTLSVVFGVPVGILMSRSDKVQRIMLPILDMLQTLPSFVYLIPLIFLFSVTEPKLYGIAIILYAIVPIIRLTDLGIRLVDRDVIEAADAFGMSKQQKLIGVQLPLALPNIMAGVNQTIVMSLAMVVIASLVSAPGLGVLVLRGIRNLELGVGLVAGFGIVLLAVVLDRCSKAALHRIDASQKSR
jgi:glycine betaine/proline transport system permease protein